MTRIVKVAVQLASGEVWSLPEPARHAEVLWAIGDKYGDEGKISLSGHVQGFLDDEDNFLDRKEACIAALESGQIESPKRTPPQDQLFSEDLW